MAMNNRPRGREKHVTGQGKDVYKRGDGLGTGPVGAGGRPSQSAPISGASAQGTNNNGPTRAAGGSPLIKIIVVVAVLLLGGGGLGSLFGGNGNNTPVQPQQTQTQQSASSSSSLGSLTQLLGGFTGSSSVSTGWTAKTNTGKLNTSVDPSARDRYTTIYNNNNDTVTIMVYMCGTDLESKSGMATADLTEMAKATLSDRVNVLVYTGGCTRWQNNIVSSSVNQIYKVESGGLRCLVDNDGSKAMTKGSTLTDFIKWCAKNYPANRNELIFWDHGGGTLSGYGYDEKNKNGGSMTLSVIDSALGNAGVKFDFIGFDACLMATTENALMLTDYADYLIASEETEPGVGWYYTDWLTKVSKNPSISTLEIGKQIIDDFVTVCGQTCSGQKTTLALIDLAELQNTAPSDLQSFAASTTELLKSNNYKTVSDARSTAREFSPSSKIDQVDLVDLAAHIGTKESQALANTLLSAVKYNRTSTNMTNAYGLSIYFPYRKTSTVKNAVSTYEAIGMDSDYARCIQTFASMEIGGQAVSGGTTTALPSLLGSLGGSTASSGGADMISSVLGGLLSGNFGGLSGLTADNTSFLSSFLDVDRATEYFAENTFDASELIWTEKDGQPIMTLSEKQWSLVQDLELSVYYDDGEGYLDLGLDDVFEFTDDGELVGAFDGTWLAINDQPVAYYHMDTVDDGENYTITGRVPVLLNGDRADLILVFDNDHPYGCVAGVRYDYHNGETETVAKALTGLNEGDRLDFLCDYYGYDGSFRDSYKMGDPMTVTGELTISNVYLPDEDAASAMYRFTDIYNQHYWTPVMP